MHLRPLLAAAFLAVLASPAAAQQVSDADRAAARDLYNAGVPLQQQGKYAEALDAFQRSFAVYPAPTTALHVAQCQASLNHLVEAEEDYRALSNATIPDGSPQAFYLAQEQAKTELGDMEPRVPKVRVTVIPERLPNLNVTVDGQPMNSALVGVARAVNPGTHRIVATAPGYSQAEQSVTVQERDVRDVRLTLNATAATTPLTPVWTGASAQPATTWNPPYTPPPKPTGPSTSFMFGVTLGASVPVGGLEADTVTSSGQSTSNKLSDNIGSPGFGLGGDVGFRFANKGYVGAQLQGGFHGAGSLNTPSEQANAKAAFLGLVLGLITNPTGVGFYGDVGAGYRWLTLNAIETNTGATSNISETYGGPEFEISLGIHIKAGPIRIIPKLELATGGFSSKSVTINSVSSSPGVTNSAIHAFFLFGVTTYFDVPIGH